MKHKYYIVVTSNYQYAGVDVRGVYAQWNHKIGQEDIEKVCQDFLENPLTKINGEKPLSAVVSFFSEIKR